MAYYPEQTCMYKEGSKEPYGVINISYVGNVIHAGVYLPNNQYRGRKFKVKDENFPKTICSSCDWIRGMDKTGFR